MKERTIFDPANPWQILQDAVRLIGPKWKIKLKSIPGTPNIETIQFQQIKKGLVEEYYHHVPFLEYEKRKSIQDYYRDLFGDPSLQVFIIQNFIKRLIHQKEMLNDIFTIFEYKGDLYRLRVDIDITKKVFGLVLYKQNNPNDSLFFYKGFYVGGIILK